MIHWYEVNFLQANPEKFQFIIFDKKRQPRYLHLNNNVIIQSVPYVKLLGITIDVDLSFNNPIEKMQLKALRHVYQDYTASYKILREKCNRPMLIIDRQKPILLEVYKCIHKIGPRYLQGMFSLKRRDYDYWDLSIMKLPKYNTITHGRRCLAYEGLRVPSYGTQ